MTAIDDLLAANREFAATFTPVSANPRVAIVICMDARIDPIRAMGIPAGQAHVLRNGGGRLVDAVRSLVISQERLGTEEDAIVHHTQSGMLTFTDDQLRVRLRKRGITGVDDMEFHPFADLEESVRDDLALYRRTPVLRQDIPVRGFIYDVATGKLSEVTARAS
jgi:carbonic anhydrase